MQWVVMGVEGGGGVLDGYTLYKTEVIRVRR